MIGLFEIDNVSLVAGHVGTEALNLPADDNSGGGDDGTGVSYDTVTLDFEASADVNSKWAFGGATADRRPMMERASCSIYASAGSESWAGATIAIGYGETDYIADRGR